MKNYKKIIKKLFLIIQLVVIILISLYFYNIYRSKYLLGTIIYKDTNYFELITENDSIYRFNYNSDLDVGENIKIKYNKQLSDFNYIQKINIKSIDNKPSSLSRNIHNILRNELNFKGIIITDDLSMSAIKGYDTKTPYIDSILAGNNILIVLDYVSAYDEIYNAIIEDKI